MEALLNKKEKLKRKKVDLKNKLNLLQKELENDEKKFQTIEECRIKKNKEKIEFLNFNTNFLIKLNKNMEEIGDPIEFKESFWRKLP